MKLFKEIGRRLTDQRSLFWYFIAVMIVPNVVMLYTESTPLIVRIASLLLPLGFYWWAMTWSRKPGKMFWALFLFTFIAAFEEVLLYMFGESPVAVDMCINAFTTNPTEVDELLGNLLPIIVTVVLFYGGAIVLSIVSWRSRQKLSDAFRRRNRRWGLIVLVVGVLVTVAAKWLHRDFKLRNDMLPVNVCYNMLLAADRMDRTAHYRESSSAFTYNASDTRPDSPGEIYVLVIGETLRADNLGVYGYERNTTPCLQSAGESAVVFKDAITMSNTTHKSVPLLLTSVASLDSYDSIYTHRSLFTAFREAGYQTAFYSNQRRNHSFIDDMGEEADEAVFVKDNVPVGHNVPDSVLIDLLTRRLAQRDSTHKLLIVLHCYGSHFNYRDRYDRGVFTPDFIPDAQLRYRPQMVNAYDNTVYHTDRLVGQVARALESTGRPCALLMTSDHGEDIYDDARHRFLHSSPLPTYYQLRVPLVVWGSSQYRSRYAGIWQQLVAHRDAPVSTNRVVFHTLLDLCGVASEHVDPRQALGNAAFTPMKRRYVNDHNEYRALDSCGLKDLDVEQFHRRGLQFP